LGFLLNRIKFILFLDLNQDNFCPVCIILLLTKRVEKVFTETFSRQTKDKLLFSRDGFPFFKRGTLYQVRIYIMKKVLLGLVTLVALTQAADIVHYDKGGKEKQTISQPNHPSTSLYN